MDKPILLVEDEIINAMSLICDLKDNGFSRINHVTTGLRAIESCNSEPPGVVLMDINLTDEMDGIEAAIRINEKNNIPVIYITGYDDSEIRNRANETSPVAFLSKPVCIQDLIGAIKKV